MYINTKSEIHQILATDLLFWYVYKYKIWDSSDIGHRSIIDNDLSDDVFTLQFTRNKLDLVLCWHCTDGWVAQSWHTIKTKESGVKEIVVPIMDFFDRGLLQTRNPLNQGFNLVEVITLKVRVTWSLVLYVCFVMESSQWEHWNHLFCRKISYLYFP
jgi:hypothetical protein